MQEIERTFLPKKLPDGVIESPSKEILDIYLPESAEHPNLRIRKSGERLEMTKKHINNAGDWSDQTENTISLTPEEYSELAKIKGKRFKKTRYYYIESGTAYEVDIFADNLEGLVLVDVEFKSNEEKAAFKPPEWCLVDVTQEEFLAGGMLCGKKYSDIEDRLIKFGYRKQ